MAKEFTDQFFPVLDSPGTLGPSQIILVALHDIIIGWGNIILILPGLKLKLCDIK